MLGSEGAGCWTGRENIGDEEFVEMSCILPLQNGHVQCCPVAWDRQLVINDPTARRREGASKRRTELWLARVFHLLLECKG